MTRLLVNLSSTNECRCWSVTLGKCHTRVPPLSRNRGTPTARPVSGKIAGFNFQNGWRTPASSLRVLLSFQNAQEMSGVSDG